MTYDDDSEWRRDDRPSWRRETQHRAAPTARAATAAARAPAPYPFHDDHTDVLRMPEARTARPRPLPPVREPAAPTTDIASMVDRIITQLDAVERTRRPDTPAASRQSASAPRAPERRQDRQPPRAAPASEPAPAAKRPFTEALRHQQREKSLGYATEEFPIPDRPVDRSTARPAAAVSDGDDIDRHFRSLAERVDALRQRTDDRISAVRDDVARLSEAVLARPVASLDPDDRAALDALAQRLERASAFGPETLDRLDAMQGHLAALHDAVAARPSAALDPRDRAALDDLVHHVERMSRAAPATLDRLDAVDGSVASLDRTIRDLDLDRRLYAIEAGQDALMERIDGAASGTGPNPAIDSLRRRIDWIAERLESAPAAGGVDALEARLVRLSGDVQRLADAPGRGGDAALARDVAAMRAELAELSRGGIVAQFDDIGSTLARLAGEVKTAARTAGAETVPIVADLVRRIERLDRRLDTLSGDGRDERLMGIERSVAALDSRLAEARRPPPPQIDPVRPHPRRAVAEEASRAPVVEAPATAPRPAAPDTARAEAVAEAPVPNTPARRTSGLIAAARRAMEHPMLRRAGDTTADPQPAQPTAQDVAASEANVVDIGAARPGEPDPDFFGPDAASTETRPADTSNTRRLLLIAAAVVGLIGGAYGFASEPLRVLVLTLSGSNTQSTVTAFHPMEDPATTGSIVRGNDAPASSGKTATVPATAPGAATLPSTLGSPGLREAAADGDPRAALEVATALIDGVGVTRDPAAAVPWLLLAAESGLAPAEFRLGTLYERGIGVSRNRDTAKAWYDRAAGRGHVKAMHNLAVLLAEAGEGRDLDRAVAWFEKAARHGLVDSQFNLAVLYVRGLGVTPDPVAAYRWFALAARQGDQEAAVRRDEIAKTLSPADRSAADLAIAGWTAVPAEPAANDGLPLPKQWTAAGATAKQG